MKIKNNLESIMKKLYIFLYSRVKSRVVTSSRMLYTNAVVCV